jgi:acyl carrier protein
MNNQLWQNLTEVFRDVIGDPKIVLEATTSAKDIPDWDSITHVLLMVAVEKKFGVKFTASEIQSLQNVGELVALLERKSA